MLVPELIDWTCILVFIMNLITTHYPRVSTVHSFFSLGSKVHTNWNGLSYIKNSQAHLRNTRLLNL